MIPILEANIQGHPLLKTNMFNYVPIKYKQMSFVPNGGKFKLYTVLNGLIFPPPTLLIIQKAVDFGPKNYFVLNRYSPIFTLLR
jgi:hypothetical protein